MQISILGLLAALCIAAAPARADETSSQLPAHIPTLPSLPSGQTLNESASPSALLTAVIEDVGGTLERALNYLGVRYKRGGSSPETGFDCSGFVKHLYNETLGMVLPHNAKAIAQQGAPVDMTELKPGDLVFFNTMRRAFSHVGIYLGDNLFIHAPRAGKRVRIEDMSDRYWSRRYNGARRIEQ